MKCPRHNVAMTALFSSYVCDLCSPPNPTTATGQLAARAAERYPQGVDAANYIRCLTCGQRAVFAYGASGDAQCLQEHVSKIPMKAGYRVENHKLPGEVHDRQWDGRIWLDVTPEPETPAKG